MGGFGRTCNAYQPTPIVDPQLPALETVLYEAYPNPFNPETTISFNLSSPNLTELYIYNQKGQKVKPCSAEIWNPETINLCGMDKMITATAFPADYIFTA